MKKLYKIAVAVGFLLIATVVAGVAVLMSLDFNEYKGLIAEKAKEATGRELTIAGDLELNISLSPSISVDGVTFSNASWGSAPDMLTLDRFAAEVALVPLLSGDIQVKQVVLQGVDVLLETDSSGVGNWTFGSSDTKSDEETSKDSATLPVVHSVRIVDT